MPIVRAAALVLSLLSATLAHATVQRTFVASTGVDTNTAFNCSIVKPCRGFAAAIGATSAKGEVIVLDSAGYGVIPLITQSITITAPTGIYAGISVFSGDGIIINASAIDTVVLRGLTINGQGGANGITITNALVVHVENCVIANMTGIGINQAQGLLEVKDTIVRNNANIGIYVVGPAVANLDHVRLEANDTGLAAEFGGNAAMQDSIVTGSPNIGVLATIVTSNVTISRSLISSNNFGVYVGGITTVSDSTITDNNVGVYATGPGGTANLKHNTITSNGTGLKVVSAGIAWADDNLINSSSVGFDIFVTDAYSTFATRDNNTAFTSSLGSNVVHWVGK
jgi:hypothetical protein